MFCRNSCSSPVLPPVFIYWTDTVSDAARSVLLVFTPLSSHRMQQDRYCYDCFKGEKARSLVRLTSQKSHQSLRPGEPGAGLSGLCACPVSPLLPP